MGRVSCIEHPAGDPFVMQRRDYMELAGGDACAAQLLSVFEGWTNTKLRQLEETGRGELWIYRNREELRRDDLCGAFGRDRIDRGLADLIAAGYLQRRRNPRAGYDRTWQYLLNVQAVQRAIGGLITHRRKSDDELRKSDDGKPDLRRSNVGDPSRNTSDSPETSTETSTSEDLGRKEREQVGTTPGARLAAHG